MTVLDVYAAYDRDTGAEEASAASLVVFKTGVLLTTLFLFFTTSTLVSFTLRETQQKMLGFTYLLHRHVRNRQPFGVLVAAHVMESLMFVPVMIGMLFFLFEFYKDQLLAFLVLVLVWQCELFAAVSMRAAISAYFFPRAVAAYFTLFHLYFLSFPHGFINLLFIATVFALQFTILFLLNHYEIAALSSGRVSLQTPRELVPAQQTVRINN